MARVAGVNLPKGKHIEIALTYIFGIGKTVSREILEKVNIPFSSKVEAISEDQYDLIRAEIKRMAEESNENGEVRLVE
jgi:small subunit ribosomal protein S13